MGSSVELAVLGLIAVACGGAALWLLLRKHLTPEQIEKRRRLAVNAHGRLVDGIVTDLRENVLFYDYSWRGMQYHSSQDIGPLRSLVLGQSESLIGPVTVKFDVRNPYDSIVICEEWSGFGKEKTSLPDASQ